MDLKSIKSLVIPINFKSFIIIFKDWQLYHDYINDYNQFKKIKNPIKRGWRGQRLGAYHNEIK